MQTQPKTVHAKWLLIGGGALAFGLTALFGLTTWQAHAAFRSYHTATLENPSVPPRWQREALSPEGCVDEAMAWVRACPGIGSWCEAAMAEPMKACMASQDRQAYCRELGDTVLSTRFGYAACKARYDAIGETYDRRAAKKSCAAAQRMIAQFCQPSAPHDVPAESS